MFEKFAGKWKHRAFIFSELKQRKFTYITIKPKSISDETFELSTNIFIIVNLMNEKKKKKKYIYIYRVTHFNLGSQITRKLSPANKNVSDKSCMVSRGP